MELNFMILPTAHLAAMRTLVASACSGDWKISML